MTDPNPRGLPADIARRLIVALDTSSVDEARAMVRLLGDTVSFYKLGYWLLLQPDFSPFLDELVAAGKDVFLDCKMYDIGETVRRGVQAAAGRGVRFLTVHGDPEIMQAAASGKAGSSLQILAVSVLTSLDDAALHSMGYAGSVAELVRLRVKQAATAGCDGIIAAAHDNPDQLRRDAAAPTLLVVTPGIRLASDTTDDHARPGTPADAIARGADYLVVGRPIVRDADPRKKAQKIIESMKEGLLL